MQLSTRQDAIVAAIIALPLPIATLFFGDPLYIGLWYYLIIPAFVIGLGVLLDAPPPYLAGASLAVAAALFVYMMINWSADRPEGLLGLGHMFSLPGSLLGYLVGLKLSKRSTRAGAILALGILGWGVGFLANQLFVCNMYMWCGPVSIFL